MKCTALILLAIAALGSLTLEAQEKADPPPIPIHLVVGGGFGFGYGILGGDIATKLPAAGQGTIGDVISVQTDIGVGVNLFDVILPRVELGWMWGPTGWQNAFGGGDSIGMHADVLDLKLEIQVIHPALVFVFPFVGGGYNLLNDFLDGSGDGFQNGQGGFFAFGGLDLLTSDSTGFTFGLRLEATWRPDYVYRNFYVDGVQATVGSFNPVFDQPMQANSVFMSIALRFQPTFR
jgi:hypothetical protein